MNLAAAATKHYGNMTGRYTWAGQRAGSVTGYKDKKKETEQTQYTNPLSPMKISKKNMQYKIMSLKKCDKQQSVHRLLLIELQIIC